MTGDPFADAPIISEYNVADAMGDGTVTRLGTTKHLATPGAISGVMERRKVMEAEALAILAESLAMATPAAIRAWEEGGVYQLDADLAPVHSGGTYWLVPSELGGVTIMRPDEY